MTYVFGMHFPHANEAEDDELWSFRASGVVRRAMKHSAGMEGRDAERTWTHGRGSQIKLLQE